jgi:hypothetical protein
MLAEAGANEVEIMRILGHTKPDQAHYYIREANKPKVTRAGMAKWEAADEAAEPAENGVQIFPMKREKRASGKL